MNPDFNAGRYRFLQTLGTGSFSTVFRALDRETGDIVAIKVTHAFQNGLWVPETAPTISREIRAMAALTQGDNQHENVVRMIDCALVPRNADTTDVWMVLENMNFDLEVYTDLIVRFLGQMDIEEIRRISYMMLKGVRHIHSNGYVHRDVKPNNALIDLYSGTVKVGDLGFAVPESEATERGNFGAPYYRSPEVYLDSAPCGRSSDMWAVGVSICRMVLGRQLFNATNEMGVLDMMLTMLGVPDADIVIERFRPLLPGYQNYANINFVNNTPVELHRIGQDGLALIAGLLAIDWNVRMTADDALASPFFDSIRDPPQEAP